MEGPAKALLQTEFKRVIALRVGEGVGDHRGDDARVEATGLVATAILGKHQGVAVGLPVQADRARGCIPFRVEFTLGQAGHGVENGRLADARQQLAAGVLTRAHSHRRDVDGRGERSQLGRRCAATDQAKADQTRLFLTILVVLGVAQTGGQLHGFGELPVDLTEEGVGFVLELRTGIIPIAARVCGCIAAKDRDWRHELRLVRQLHRNGLLIAFFIVVGPSQPLNRTISGGSQIQLVAEPMLVLLIVGHSLRENAQRCADTQGQE